ncbi:MAG: nucleotide exchange factor GrpE [bacterium]
MEPSRDPAAPGREAEEAAGVGSEEAAGSGSAEAAAEVSADLDNLLEEAEHERGLLEEAERERDEYLELARRARADFDNYRKRAARDAAEAERRGRSVLAKALLPSLDNLERALNSAEAAAEGLTQGVELVYRELREALARAGVEAYDPAGESFDPAWHEAVTTRAADGAQPGTVVETLAKGYRLDDQVLRAAKVVVGE